MKRKYAKLPIDVSERVVIPRRKPSDSVKNERFNFYNFLVNRSQDEDLCMDPSNPYIRFYDNEKVFRCYKNGSTIEETIDSPMKSYVKYLTDNKIL